MATAVGHDDYALERVPASARFHWFSVATQRFGQLSSLASFLLGATLGFGMDFWSAGEADVIVLGCTGMLGVAAALQRRLEENGTYVPVVDPTGAAVAWLESSVRLGVRPSRTTYMRPPVKARSV